MTILEWMTLCEEVIVFDKPIDPKMWFDKLIDIWRTQCQSINRRLAGCVLVEQTSADFEKASRLFSDLSPTGDDEIRKVVPKTALFSQNCYELSRYQDSLCVSFHPRSVPSDKEEKHAHIPFEYAVDCRIEGDKEKSVRLSIRVSSTALSSGAWLKETAFPAMTRWLARIDLDRKSNPVNRLIDLESYTLTYRRIKQEHGKALVEAWTERTDPYKFVYEDCGIAAYLIELWKSRGIAPKKFADIGCGNGLLVYLLNKEGYCGMGLDIRRRKLWDDLLKDTDLRECTVDPSSYDNGIPPDVDFLIGNHSDELTPWMAVMASRLNCPFFVLPCCPFDFHGKYQQRPGDTGSVYQGFLHFVHHVSVSLGYSVEEDRLSIPSSKRLAYVCTVPSNGLVRNREEVIGWLTEPSAHHNKAVFVAREKVEKREIVSFPVNFIMYVLNVFPNSIAFPVANCTNMDVEMRQRIVRRIVDRLIGMGGEEQGWRSGGSLKLGAVIALLTDDERQAMRQQNGGIQTFLKNNHQVFKLDSGGVRVRDWRRDGQGVVCAGNLRKTACWMHSHHPDGCPLEGHVCTFRHEQEKGEGKAMQE